MIRFLAGVVSALLLVAAGFFIWRSQAEQESLIPPAPDGAPIASPLRQPPQAEPPAAPARSREEARFARYDKNENGLIARAEMMESRRAAWSRLDKNGNGSLDFEEWAVRTSERFAKADADRDGNLTPAEFATTRPAARPKAKCAC